jgi:hypothetical protein
VREDFAKFKEERLASAPGGLARAALEDRFSTLELQTVEQAEGYESKARTAHQKTQIEGAVDSSLALVLLHPERYGDTLRQNLEIIEGSALDPASKADMARDFTHALAEAHWTGRLQDDPAGVQALLTETSASGLKFEDRMALIGKARAEVNRREGEAREEQRWQFTLADREEKLADRAREEAGAGFTAAVIAGQASTAEIAAAVGRRLISASEGRTLANILEQDVRQGVADARAARSEARASRSEARAADAAERAAARDAARIDDDPTTVAALIALDDENHPELRTIALEARRAKLIGTATMAKFAGEDAKAAKETGPLAQPLVKEAKKQLKPLLTPTGLAAILDPADAEKVVKANDLFNARMLADPKADPAKVRDEVVAAVKNPGQVTDRPLRPRYLEGTIAAPDPVASIAAVEAARARGEITDEEMAVELQALQSVFEANRALVGPRPSTGATGSF